MELLDNGARRDVGRIRGESTILRRSAIAESVAIVGEYVAGKDTISLIGLKEEHFLICCIGRPPSPGGVIREPRSERGV